jgi:phage-related tail fiber protein
LAEKFYTILTNIGKAKIANSGVMGSKVNFVKFKIGDSGGNYYEPTEDQKDLVHTVYEGNITDIEIDTENSNWMKINLMIPANVGGFTIREYGVFDEDGNMLAIAKCAESYKPIAEDGSTKELILRMILAVSNTKNVNLELDPTLVFVTKEELDGFKNSITTQLSEITQKQNKFTEDANGKLLYNGNKVGATKASELTLDPISGMSSTNVQAGIAEAFQYANNGKTSIANVVGKVTGSNTHAQIASEIQTDKNTIATNITSKGISANGTETLASLAGKVGQISLASLGGKRVANSTIASGTASGTTLSITLGFQPTTIIAYYRNNSTGDNYCCIHSPLTNQDLSYYEWADYHSGSSGITILSTGFTLKLQTSADSGYWVAYE